MLESVMLLPRTSSKHSWTMEHLSQWNCLLGERQSVADGCSSSNAKLMVLWTSTRPDSLPKASHSALDLILARCSLQLPDVLKLVLEVAGTSLVRIEHCKSQRLVLSVKGNIDKLQGVPVRARGLC